MKHILKSLPFVALALVAPLALPSAAEARVSSARCVIEAPAGTYNGPCRFQSERGGSFSVDRADERRMVGDVTMVSLFVTGRGTGDVRGLTTGGINSRWGSVRRSSRDRACWVGSDFRVCAY